ncbi:MAG TPA: glycosyltransferase family 4 protein [Syntrophomonadaceae bacterium]|nr:glycosyltransferase family 4 protein [Syntrophomonadaceae bacterium]
MRIGVFSDSYKPYQSGVVTSILTFKEELNRKGHEIYIFAPSYPNYIEEEEGVHRFMSVPSPTNPDFALAIPVLPGLSSLIKHLKLDLIHVQSPFTMGRVGLRYANKFQLPLVFTYHTLYDQYAHYVPVAQDLAREMTVKYSIKFCNHCDHVVVPCAEIQEVLQSNLVNRPISVIPTGVSLEKFARGDDKWLHNQYGIGLDKKILLFVGRLTREKNLEFLIESFAAVHTHRPDTVLVLVARGPLEQPLKTMTREMGLEDDVIFTGALPFETLVHAYYSADLFVFSSMTETQGLVLLEAMACGLPVVAVRACGVQDMVESGVDGILTECRVEDFSQAICQVLAKPDVYNYYQSNALRKANTLSAVNMAASMESLYMELCQREQPRRTRTEASSSWMAL